MPDQLVEINGPAISDPEIVKLLAALWSSPFSAVEFELQSSSPSGDLYQLEFEADVRGIYVELLFHAIDPLLVSVTTVGRWTRSALAQQLALREAVVALHDRGLTLLRWRSPPMLSPLARVTSGATPTFAFQRGFSSVTQVSVGVYELKLISAVDFGANAAAFVGAVRAVGSHGADASVAPVDGSTLRVTVDDSLTGAPADIDFYVRVDSL